MRCVTCGQELPDDPKLRVDLRTNVATRGVVQVRLTPQEAEALVGLLQAPGWFLTYTGFANTLWGGYRGDPKSSRIKVLAWTLKQQIAALGLELYNVPTKGYGLRLMQADTAANDG